MWQVEVQQEWTQQSVQHDKLRGACNAVKDVFQELLSMLVQPLIRPATQRDASRLHA